MSATITRARFAALFVLVTLGATSLPLISDPARAANSFTAQGHIQFAEIFGVSTTETEFRATCPTIPDSQGEDAYIFTLPDGFDVTDTTSTARGSSASTYDLDFYYYGSNCARTGTDFDEGTDESGLTPAGTKYVIVAAWDGSAIDVTLTVSSDGGVDPSPTPSDSPTPSPTSGGARGTYPLEPNDPLFPRQDLIMGGQWGMRIIQGPEAWQEQRATGAGITVSVIDTGLDLDHPDFSCPGKVKVVPSSDLIETDDVPNDEDGHGTHVAGIVGACTNNGKGVVGVAPDSTIMPIRVLDEDGNGTVLSSPQAIRTATDNGAHVLNFSLGTLPVNTPIELLITEVFPEINRAIEYAVERGVVIVAAAGNDTNPLCGYPAIAQHIICVGSTDNRDLNSYFGNFPVKGDEEDDFGPGVMAPGGSGQVAVFCNNHAENIVSTYLVAEDGCDEGYPGYRGLNGTSMASPHVAGVAALVYDRLGGERTATNGQKVVDAIIENTDDLYAPGYDPASGYGRVNALKAVTSLDPAVDPSPSPTETQVRDTEVSFTGDVPASGQFTDTASLSAVLTDDEGTPIADEMLTFQLLGRDGFRHVSATTASDGTASANILLDAPPGDYDVIVGYSGKTDTYNASSESRPFELLREDATAVAEVKGNGSKTVITGTLLDADSSHPVPQGVLAFYADGSFIGDGLTNDQGEIFFDVPSGYRGKKTEYEIRFSGDRFFLPSNSAVMKN